MTTPPPPSERPVSSPSARRMVANERLMLDDLTRMWVVIEGSVEIFLVRVLDGEPVGPRRWLFTASAGTAMFAIPPSDGDSLILVTVAASDGEIEEFCLAEALAATRLSRETRHWVAGLIDSWLEAVGSAIARFGDPGVTDLVPPEAAVAFEADRRIGTAGAVVWVLHQNGHSWFAGQAGMIALRNATGAFPLARGAWMLTRTPVELETFTTAQWLRASANWEEFTIFRNVFAGWAGATEYSAEAEERERRLRRAAANWHMKDRALAELASAIGDGSGPSEPDSKTVTDALLAACRAIGHPERIRFIAPSTWDVTDGVMDPLAAICASSRVRSRRVLLAGEWWLRDHGSLLCRYREGRLPLAALRGNTGRYEVFNPADGTRVPMTAQLAEEMEPFGVVFYRPLPDTPITTRALVRFVLEGMAGSLWGIAFVAVLAGILGLFLPFATGFVFSQVIPSSMKGQLFYVFVGLTIAALSAQTFELVRAYSVLRLEGRSATAMQAAVFDRLLQLPAPFFKRYTVGDLVSRVNGVGQVRQLLSAGAVTALLGGLTGSLNLILLFRFAPSLARLVSVLAVCVGAIIVLISWRAKRLQDQIQDTAGSLEGLVFQLVSGIAKLRVAGAEDRALAMWAHRYSRKVRLEQQAARAGGMLQLITTNVPLMASILTFGAVGALMDTAASVDVATFVAFTSAMGAFLAATMAMANTLVGVVQIAPLMRRASVILLEPPEVTAARPAPGRLTGRIEGRNLSFRYAPDQPRVLSDVSFYAEPGEFVAFVGPSGSGKSTALRLLLGLETPETGAVYFDGQDLSTIDVSAVRRQMGVVLQSSRLMAGDILSNIIGSSPLTIDDAWRAAEMAGFADDVRDMPMKLNTVVSEGGSTLSGGQRQRLLIARALVHRPRILLFDEATSALDNRTQRIVSDSLDRMHATRIVIAHRLTTIEHADRVYVIDAGRVVEWGKPSDLLAGGGVFAQLAARQLA